MNRKFNEDDYCDIYENKICDNCGKCLEDLGIDIRAIKIEDIAKDIEENKILEEEWKDMIFKAQNIDPSLDEEDIKKALREAYSSLNISNQDIAVDKNDEYIDAFDKIEYLDDYSLNEENGDLEEMTEEIFPGMRRIIKKNRE